MSKVLQAQGLQSLKKREKNTRREEDIVLEVGGKLQNSVLGKFHGMR